MYTNDDPVPPATLETFEAALFAARDALFAQPLRPLDAVGWLSAHLAATERVLHRSLAREQRRLLRAAAHTLQEEVRWLEQVHSGDALVSGRDAGRQRQQVLDAIDAYAEAQRVVLTTAPAPRDEGTRDLAAAYRRALVSAPTRPHPHLPTRGVAGAVAFRLEAWWDRAMNTMDSRHVPTPRRERRVAAAGKWTAYLMGSVSAER
jgi:hypothetical protein